MDFSYELIRNGVGSLVLAEDGTVLLSSGQLANEEKVASTIHDMLNLTDSLGGEEGPSFDSMSVIFKNYSLKVAKSDRKIFIVKVENNESPPPEPEPH